jgi:glycosyltransferase involved in cell wall biosynthesis
MAKVSIIIPSFNHSKFLTERLNSIKNQTYTDWEAIIIDDKSTDNSVQILSEFASDNKAKIKQFIINKNNSGSGYFSWQKGIELADTEFIWIAETDDYSDKYFLEEQINLLINNPQCTLSFCSSNYVNESKEYLYNSKKRTHELNVLQNEFKVFEGNVLIKKMPFNTYITNGSSVVFRRPKQAIPPEIFDNKLCSDLFLWSFLVQNNSFAFLNKNLNFFRRHEGSISTYLQKNKMEAVFHEKAKYLNYFAQTEKFDQFLEHYIKNYIWTHKRDFLNTSSIQKLQINRNLIVLYYYKLIKFIISKLTKK